MPEITKQGAWKVEFTEPMTSERSWVRNRQITVVASTMERSIDLIREQYPDAIFIAIHKVSGDREIIVDDQ